MKKIDELLGKLMQAAFTCKKHHVFIQFLPHVNWIEIQIYKNGYANGKQYENHRIRLSEKQAEIKIKELTKYINYLGGGKK